MPGRVHLSVPDVEVVIDNFHRAGNHKDADGLSALLNSVKPRLQGDTNLDGMIDDGEYVAILMGKSPVEEGGGLTCAICNKPVPKLYSGVCDTCFRPWALSTKRGAR